MSYQQDAVESLRILKYVKQILIRPYGRFNGFVGYLVYTAEGQSKYQFSELHPVVYNIEVNETTQSARIRDESTETVFYFTGGMIQRERKMLVYNKHNNYIGSVCDNHAIEEIAEGSHRPLHYRELPNNSVNTVKYCLFNKHITLGGIVTSAMGSSMSVYFRKVNVLEKFMFLATGIKIIHCKRLFHSHPLPRNILNTREASIPSSQPVLETLNECVLRVAFHDLNGHLFVDILNSATHNIELVLCYLRNESEKKLFLDICGRLQFTSERIDVFEVVSSVNGQEIGRINRAKPTSFIDSSTGHKIMEYEKKTSYLDHHKKNRETHQVFVSGYPDQVLCEFYQHNAQGNVYINFAQAVGVERKAMIIAEVASLLRYYFKSFLSFFKPNVHKYPFKSQEHEQ